jgi:hypothetical protein
MNNLLQWLAERAGERSTWVGILSILTAITGVTLPADQAAAVTTAGVAIAGLVLVFTRAKPKDPPQ